MGGSGLAFQGITPLPEVAQSQPWRRSPSRAQRGWVPGPWQLARHMPDVASLKGTCLSCWKPLAYQRVVKGLGHPVSWDTSRVFLRLSGGLWFPVSNERFCLDTVKMTRENQVGTSPPDTKRH